MFKNYIFFLLMASIGISCTSRQQRIVNEAIAAHGGDAYDKINVSLDFRGIHYDFERKNGQFNYQRTQTDSSGAVIKDILTNAGLIRNIDGKEIELDDSTRAKYSRSVNSVAYFLLLPYGLNDPAVIKTDEGQVEFYGKKYDQIRVTFKQDGGGEDHQDKFLYWFRADSHMLDYFAYSYETNGRGVRFRAAKNRQTINGVVFQDYDNFGLEDAKFPLEDLPLKYVEATLPLLSEIKNENINLETKLNPSK